MYNTEERVNTEDFSRKVRIIAGWWFGTFFIFHNVFLWDVIQTPLTNSIIFQAG
jgi:hypothetical protein